MEYCCHRPDRVVVGRIGQRLCNCGLEKPPRGKGSVHCSVGSWERSWEQYRWWRPGLWSFRGSKGSTGPSVGKLCGIWKLGLRSQLWLRDQHYWKKPLRHWDNGCWLAGKEKFAVIKKRPVLLSPSDSICCFKLKTPSVTTANIFYLNMREI